MTARKVLARVGTLAVVLYALLLTTLIPAFFLNYGSDLFHKLAAIWPLHH